MRRWWWIVAVVAAGFVGWAGFHWLRPKKAAVEYRTAQVERGSIVATVSATGTLNPVTMVQVGSQVSGVIQRLDADFNSKVRQGQIVAQLDPSFFRSQFAQAEASMTRAEVDLADAERTFRRSQELLTRNLNSQADVDAQQAAVDRAKAQLKQAKATVDQARVNLEHTTIASPIDGVVVARNVDVGQTVAASLQAPVLFEIANDLTHMQVEASIDEADIGQVAAGQPAHFTVDAYPDEKFRGIVSQIRLQPITVQNVVTYTTVIAVDNPEQKLRPGMTANVSVEVARRDNVIKVPNGALSFRPAFKNGDREGGGGTMVASAAVTSGAQGAGGTGDARESRGEWRRRQAAGGAGADTSAGARAAWRARRQAREGAAGSDSAGGHDPTMDSSMAGAAAARMPGMQTVWTLNGSGKPRPVQIRTGITDGYFTELLGGSLGPGDQVLTGLAGAGGQGQRGGSMGSTTAKNPLAGGRRF